MTAPAANPPSTEGLAARPAGWRWAFRIATAWSVVSLAGILATVGLSESLDVVALASTALPPFLSLSICSYLLRLLRWHWLIRRIVPNLHLVDSAVIATIGVALTITPGRLGELLKFRLVEEVTGHQIWQTAPVVLIEKIGEATGFLALVVVGAVLLGAGAAGLGSGQELAVPAALALLALIVLPILVRIVAGQLLPRLEVAAGWRARAHALLAGFVELATPRELLPPVALSIVARGLDVLAVWWVLQALGQHVSFAASAFAFGAGSFAAGISFLPGGMGIAEAGTAGLLTAAGVALPAAVAVSLLSRVGSLWLWIIVGLVLLVRWQPRPYRPVSRR